MQINFLGDSITEGAGASAWDKRFSTLVCRRLGATENNFGVGGTRIAPQTDKAHDLYGEHFILRAAIMPQDADFTFVMGGTNDFGHGDAPLGNVDDTEQNTFCAAFAALAAYMCAQFGKEKVCFILPLPRFNQNNPWGDGTKKRVSALLSEYIAAEKTLLDRVGLRYLDVSDIFPAPQTDTGDAFTVDGLHPNDKGHAILAERVVEYFTNRTRENR